MKVENEWIVNSSAFFHRIMAVFGMFIKLIKSVYNIIGLIIVRSYNVNS